MKINIIDLETNEEIVREETEEERTNREATEQASTVEQTKRHSRFEDAQQGINKILEIPNVRAKLKAVNLGTDTLSVDQLQRIVAGLALLAVQGRE